MRRGRRRFSRVGTAVAVLAVLAAGGSLAQTDQSVAAAPTDLTTVAEAPSTSEPAPSAETTEPTPAADGAVFGPAAVEALGDQLDEVAALNEMTTDELVDSLQDPTYGLDGGGKLFVADFAEGDHDHEADDQAPVAQAAVVPLDQTFNLNSLPGSNRTIYLDFDGHTLTNTVWNQQQGIPNGRTVAAFSLDGSPAFSDAELEFIQNVWLAVSEDYAPFDVNVTTQDPGAAALTRSNGIDQVYGARAIITSPQVQADFPSNCPITSTCGGLAYVGVLDAFGSTRDANGNAVPAHPYYEGAFINAADITNPLEVTTIVSHEIGHNAGLNHAGYNAQDYYSGTGNWGPIMGTPYNRALSQWTQHSYSGANNDNGPDLPILANNGIASRADDTGQTLGTAVPTGWTTRAGSITAPTDQDLWSLGRCTGTVTITATPSTYSTNLDVSLSLVTDVSGSSSELASADPASGSTGAAATLRATGVSATVTRSADGAPYYALVKGSTSGPDGGYGNLGPYTLTATCAGTSVPPSGLPTFTDVSSGHTFFTQIEWLSAQGVSTGYDNGNGTKRFEPSAAVLREQMAAFLARYADAELQEEPSDFTDVAPTHVFTRHIAWLAATGISTGYANGDGTFSFRPGQPVLREQMAAFLYRLAGATATATSCGLLDVPPTHTFAKQICWLKGTNITTGYAVPGGTEFRGSQPVLREQMAAFLFRYDAAGLPVP